MLCEYQTDNNKPENDTNIKLLLWIRQWTINYHLFPVLLNKTNSSNFKVWELLG